jgi:hypothetical protein
VVVLGALASNEDSVFFLFASVLEGIVDVDQDLRFLLEDCLQASRYHFEVDIADDGNKEVQEDDQNYENYGHPEEPHEVNGRPLHVLESLHVEVSKCLPEHEEEVPDSLRAKPFVI